MFPGCALRGDLMYGLPQATELNKQLPKKGILAKAKLNPKGRAEFDADISKLAIVAEISLTTTNLPPGDSVAAFYVIQVSLRRKDYKQKNIMQLAKLIGQNLLFVLEYEGQARLAVYHTKLLQSDWIPLEEVVIKLSGLDLDAVWENIVILAGGVKVEAGYTLDEQIMADEEREKLRRKINKLERLARNEKQPRRKFELVQEVRKMVNKLEGH